MKNRLLLIIVSTLILTTSTGFGFLETTTIKQAQVNQQIKFDSVKNATYSLQIIHNPSLIKKQCEKNESGLITKSIIQSVGNLVKNITLVIFNLIIEAGTVILKIVLKVCIGYNS